MIAAQFKSGKTTLIDNVLRSLVDGDPFLGAAHVEPLAGAVALLDTEMPAPLLDGWLRAQRIAGDDRVFPVSLRGRVATFDLLTPPTRASRSRFSCGTRPCIRR